MAKTSKKTPRRPRKQALPAGLKVRNKEIRRVRVGDILENPANFRGHPQGQRDAFQAAVNEIGWFGHQDVFEHPDHPGKVMLVDGELRKEDLVAKYGEDAHIDVNVTDFSPDEAAKALATKDPLAAMASTETEKLEALLKSIDSDNEEFSELIKELAEKEGISAPAFEPVGIDEQGQLDEKEPFQCPNCGHEWTAH